jgi:hypothetical protein
MTFGRPTMTTHLTALPLPSSQEDDQFVTPNQADAASENSPSKMRFYVEALKLYGILGRILVKIYQPWMIFSNSDVEESSDRQNQSMNDIVEIDAELTAFELALPPFLSWKQPQEGTPPNDQQDHMVYRMQTNVLHARYAPLWHLFSKRIANDVGFYT